MPYVDPHAFTYLHHDIDPALRKNSTGFCEGYWRFREGTNYPDIPQTSDHLAGWCYGLTEGKEPPKPLWQCKTFWGGIALIIASMYGRVNTESIVTNPEALSNLGTVFGVLFVYLRVITKAAVRK